MANIQISQLSLKSSLAATDQFAVDDSNGVSWKVTASQVLAYINTQQGFVGGLLSMSAGGTNANLTPSLGAMPYSTATALTLLAPGTSGQVFQSGGAGAPSWTSTLNSSVQANITSLGTITSGTWQASVVGITYGGTGVASVTSTPTASAWAGWDANQNLFANNFIASYSTTVTAAGTTTLTNASTSAQFFTGTTTQTVLLPVTSTLSLGWQYYFVNNSTGAVTVQSSGGNNVVVLPPGATGLVTCILTSGTTAASWNADFVEAENPNASSVLVSNSSASALWLPSLTNGQVVIGSTGATPVAATITGTGGFVVTNGAGSISITATSLTALTGSIQAPTFVGDSSGNKLLSFNYVASPTNYLEVKNAASNADPLISALGTDFDIDIGLKALGAGYVYCTNTSAGNPPFAFQIAGNSHFTLFTSVGLTADRTFTFPNASGNVVAASATPTASGVLVSTSANVPTWLSSLTNGQLVIGSTGATPVAATLSGSTGLSITNNAGGITLTNTVVPAAGVGITVTNAANVSTIAANPVTSTLSYNAGAVAWALSSNPWIFSTYTAVTGNATVSAASGGLTGAAYTFVHVQAASGGPFTLAWNSNYKFPQGIVPTVTTTASAVDMFTFIWDGTFMRCVGIAQNIS